MTSNTKIVVLSIIGCVALLSVLLLVRDVYLKGGTTNCGDPQGPRPKIDMRNFETNYTGYAIILKTDLAGKGEVEAKLEPQILQKLSDAIESGLEFRKSLVAGYNGCAVSRSDYQTAVNRFQALDELARRIDLIIAQPSVSDEDRKAFLQLANEYVQIASQLSGGSQ